MRVTLSILLILTLAGAYALGWMHALDWVVIHWGQAIERRRWLLWPLLVVGQIFMILIGDPGHAFIYFQF